MNLVKCGGKENKMFYKYSNDYPSNKDFIFDFIEGRIAVNIVADQLPQFLDTVQTAVISQYDRKYYNDSLEVLYRSIDKYQFVSVYIRSYWDDRMGYNPLYLLDEPSYFTRYGLTRCGDVVWNSSRRLKADDLLRLLEVEVQL